MSQPFSEYIKIIGKGKKGSRSLTREEAFDAMRQLLAGEVTGDQRGAFLMLLRTREETPDEIIGFIDACRLLIEPELKSLAPRLDIGCYAGKRRQLPWYLLSVAVLAANGYKTLLHGAHEPGSGRLYASKALPTLGLDEVTSIQTAKQQLETYNVTYLDLGYVLPSLNTLIKLRVEFGLRSCANTLARLLNPSAAPYCVQGVYHMHLDHKHRHVNEAFPNFDALCFRGDGGDPEVNSERPTELFVTRNGKTEVPVLPEMTEGWAMKDKSMALDTMLQVWAGEIDHGYGLQATLASLTSYILLLENLDVQQAQEKAVMLWQDRNKQGLPFTKI